MTGRSVTGVVLAAGGSSRLGTPKQLLPYSDTSLLGASVDTARTCGFDQLIVTLGGDGDRADARRSTRSVAHNRGTACRSKFGADRGMPVRRRHRASVLVEPQ